MTLAIPADVAEWLLLVDGALDGWSALITNQDPVKADATAVFLAYRGQPKVERRYCQLNGRRPLSWQYRSHLTDQGDPGIPQSIQCRAEAGLALSRAA